MYIRIATYAPTCFYTPTHFLYNPAHAKHVNRFKILWVYADCWQALGEVVECIALQACSVPEKERPLFLIEVPLVLLILVT